MAYYMEGLGVVTIVSTLALIIAGSIMPTEVPLVFSLELVLASVIVMIGAFIACTSKQCDDRFYKLLGVNLYLVAIGSFYIGTFISEFKEVSVMYGTIGSFLYILGSIVIFVPAGRPTVWASLIQQVAGGIMICIGSLLFSTDIEAMMTEDDFYPGTAVSRPTMLMVLMAGLCLLQNGFLLSYIDMQRKGNEHEHPEVIFFGLKNNIFLELLMR